MLNFELAEDSDILSNRKDARDFNVFRDYQAKRDRTDRFVLKLKDRTHIVNGRLG